jgi:hypothetical protein
VDGGGRGRLAPQIFDELSGDQSSAGVQGQVGQHGSLPRATDGRPGAAGHNLGRPEQPELHQNVPVRAGTNAIGKWRLAALRPILRPWPKPMWRLCLTLVKLGATLVAVQSGT